MRTSENGIHLIKRFEGLHKKQKKVMSDLIDAGRTVDDRLGSR